MCILWRKHIKHLVRSLGSFACDFKSLAAELLGVAPNYFNIYIFMADLEYLVMNLWLLV